MPVQLKPPPSNKINCWLVEGPDGAIEVVGSLAMAADRLGLKVSTLRRLAEGKKKKSFMYRDVRFKYARLVVSKNFKHPGIHTIDWEKHRKPSYEWSLTFLDSRIHERFLHPVLIIEDKYGNTEVHVNTWMSSRLLGLPDWRILYFSKRAGDRFTFAGLTFIRAPRIRERGEFDKIPCRIYPL